MKKLFFISIVSFLLSLSQSVFAQLVLPDYDDVCPGQEIQYTVQSSYYGDGQEFYVNNGVFIVADSLYKNDNDSTIIIMDVDSSNSTFNIRWGVQGGLGGIYLNNQQSYECNIYSSYFSSLWNADSIVLTGNHNFYVEIKVYNADINNTLINKSSNIISANVVDIIGIPYSTDAIYKYRCQITGYEDGWINFITSGPASSTCSSITKNTITVDVQRKLSPVSLGGVNSICGSYQTYSVTSYDSPSETFTWNVSDGLKIYKNGQYLTNYTGSETSVQVYEPNSGSGNGYVKVKANATDYVSSEEALKMIWFGDILPMNIRLNDALTGFPKSEFCYGDPNLVEATYIDGDPYIDEWGWDVTGAYITIENPYGDKSRATIHPTSYSSFNVKLRAHNTCGWSGWADMGVSVITCGGYYMTMYPNPASSYVELSFTEAETIEPDITKSRIKLKDNKNDKDNNIDEYLVQILDKNGLVRKSIHSKSLNMNIDIRDLEPGTYYLHLTFNDELYKQQLIIQ